MTTGVPLSGGAVPLRRPLAAVVSPLAARAVPALAGVAVLGLAAASGGYFPSSWGWAALAFAWAGLLVLALGRDVALDRLQRVFLASLAGLAGLVWLSLAWTRQVGSTVFEGERVLVLLAGAAAALLVLRRRDVSVFLGSLVGGVTLAAGYGLATRLFPRPGSFDPVAGYRLAEPLGYWNALGILCALGVLLALGLGAHATGARGRAAAGVALLVLAPTLYFTYSRGAWAALGIGLAVALAFAPARLRLGLTALALAPAPAAVVLLASRSDALTHQTAQLTAAAHDGRRVALALLVLAVPQAFLAARTAPLVARLAGRRTVALRCTGAAAAVAVVALAVGALGAPWTVAAKAYDSFAAAPPATPTNLNNRLFSLSGNGRADLWRAGLDEAGAHPLLGGGAGTYQAWWLQRRSSQLEVRDAHNLYIELLAELGPLGLALLALVLGAPVLAAVRARRHPLVAPALGAFAAFAVHAGVDWDWEVPAVTLTALLIAVGLLAAGRGERLERSPRLRIAFGAGGLAIVAVAFVALVGNMHLARSEHAAAQGRWAASAAEARAAQRWLPWSAEPWRLLGEAQLVRREDGAARGSLRAAIGRDGESWTLWLDLAAASRGQAARAALDRAHALNPLADLGGVR